MSKKSSRRRRVRCVWGLEGGLLAGIVVGDGVGGQGREDEVELEDGGEAGAGGVWRVADIWAPTVYCVAEAAKIVVSSSQCRKKKSVF